MKTKTENKYAVVGLGGIFPDAKNLDQFWENILSKRVSIRPLPEDSIEREVFYRPDCRSLIDKGDRSYTDLFATLDSIDFDPQRFRIPPTVAAHMDRNQKLALLVAEQALSSGGLDGVPRERVAVVMGNSMMGQTHHDAVTRFGCDKFEYYLRRNRLFAERLSAEEQNGVVAQVRARIVGSTLGVTEDTAPGVLPNIIAARICSVFDLRGHAYVIDAACASALAAIISGIQQLRLGEYDAVLCGAADFHNEEIGRVYFSGMGALSAEGSFPFDERASGFVPGDGAGAVLLKRLDDAIAAGNPVLAVITGYGQVSDGKGKAIAAPNQVGQAAAIRRAWEMAGAPVDTVELIEAHGTATQVGDLSEVSALKRCFDELGAKETQYCGIGSVKSNIGHLKSAAGVAGFAKAVLAIGHKVLPPTAGFRTENPKLQLTGSPFYVLSEPRDWPARQHPRRAGVSAFGFGGANYHIALEEYREQDYAAAPKDQSVPQLDDAGTRAARVSTRQDICPSALGLGSPSSPELTSSGGALPLMEPVCFSADGAAELEAQLAAFLGAVRRPEAVPGECILAQNLKARSAQTVRLAFVYRSVEDLEAKILLVKEWIKEPSSARALRAKGLSIESGPPIERHRVAALFPGQGSQYPDMLTLLRLRFPAAAHVFRRADACWRELTGHGVTELIDSSERGFSETEALLRLTENTHPALVVSSLAAYRLLEEMGFEPAVLAGHSVGEFTALAAARMLSFTDALGLVHARGSALGSVPEPERGAMLAVPASVEDALALIRENGTNLTIANVNAPRQTIVSGHEAEVLRLMAVCQEKGIKSVRLNVSHAFHSPLMASAERQFRESLARARFCSGRTRVIANASSQYYGDSPGEIRAKLETQITDSVLFARSIQKLYDDGIRLFVEVGPSSVLSSLTRECLGGRDATVVSSDTRRGDSLDAFHRMICSLFAAGVAIDPSTLTSSARPTHTDTWVVPVKSPGVVNPSGRLTLIPPPQAEPVRVVYSGVSIGLPGSYKDVFRDDNFDQLFDGHNLIERLSDVERERLVDLSISKVVKSEQGATFATLSSLSEVIQLAGKLGRLDLSRDYQLDEKDVVNMSSAIALAVAAGYEALRDAHIPLIHEYSRTAAGKSLLPERWALPQEMQRHTGVIFANGFPMVDPIIKEVSLHLGHRFGTRIREELFEFYDTLIAKVTDRDARKLLADWYSLNRGRLGTVLGEEEVYRFNHHLMTQIAMQANNRLARFINARGPNFQLNAACSSAATAVTLAEELIRGGRARRMIVIGADDPSSEYSLPYLGAGFLSTGACSNEADLHKAAVPFDRRRNGMIMGAGAVGIIVEADSECQRRGVAPVCDLLGTHAFNTAGHGSQLDVPRYAEELDMFMTRMEAQHGLYRETMAKSLVYVSHETYTPARGGCSEAEAVALRHVFGAHSARVEVSNTKGMTGHTMGASIEEAVAAKSLQFGRSAPVVNYKEPDPALEGLKLSVGAPADYEYALRMAAGFGSQGNYILLGRRARGEARIEEPARYQAWLAAISGVEDPELTHRGRVLVVKDARPGSVVVDRPRIESCRPGARPDVKDPPNPLPSIAGLAYSHSPARPASVAPQQDRGGARRGEPSTPHRAESGTGLDARATVFEVVSEITGYPREILELDMELESDLGVDTVKQATVLGRLAERFHLPESGSVRLSDYPTLRSIVEFFGRHADGSGAAAQVHPAPAAASVVSDAHAAVGKTAGVAARRAGTAIPARVESVARGPAPQSPAPQSPAPQGAAAPGSAASAGNGAELVTAIIAEVTGYPANILDDDMQLESDLGIDTVKQATILSLIGDRLGVIRNESLRMSDFATIRQLKTYFGDRETRTELPLTSVFPNPEEEPGCRAGTLREAEVDSAPPAPEGTSDPKARSSREKSPPLLSEEEISRELYAIVGRLSPYPAEMLEAELELDNDWAPSPTERSALEEALRERFGLPKSWQIPRGVTLGGLTRVLRELRSAYASLVGGAQWLGRQTLQLSPAPAEPGPGQHVAGKHIWILGDDPHCVARAVRWFEDCQVASATEIVFPASGSVSELEGRLAALLAGTRPHLVVDLTACPGSGDILDDEPAVVLGGISRAADCRFALWKAVLAGSYSPERVLAVTALDGSFALGRPQARASVSALYGLHLGFYKGLRKELSGSRVSLLDVSPSSWAGDASGALALVHKELETTGPGVEICYVDGERHRIAATDGCWEVVDTSPRFSADEVVLATGGGSGITARIVLELARQHPARFALVGRTELDETARGFRFDDEAAVSAERSAIGQRLAARGQRVTPRMIEERLARLTRSAEVFATLEELERLGSRARYYHADVTDPGALEAVITDVRQSLGPITTILHGAGIEVSHVAQHKPQDEFRRVHAVKSVGAYQLGRICRSDPLRRFISISSISGRFGNLAQLDYSTANSFLDVMARTGRQQDIRALSLAWSGWSGFGMAWRNSFVREHAESLGLHFIDPGAGAAAAALEIAAATGPAEIVIHRGLGEVADRDMLDTDLGHLPFVDWVERRGGAVTAVHRRFSSHRDGLLDDHRFAGLPFMPGVGFMEMMAEAVSVAGSKRAYPIVFRDLAFLDAFKLYREEPRDVRAELTPGPKPGQYELCLVSPFTPRVGGGAELRAYAKASVELGGVAPEVPPLGDWVVPWSEETDYAALLARAQNLQHNVRLGPLLNDAGGPSAATRGSRVRLGREGSETLVMLPAAQLDHPRYPRQKFLINPAFLDAMHQAGAVLAIALTGHVYLPVGAAEFVVFDAPEQDERYRIIVRIKELRDSEATYDIAMLRDTGACCAAIIGSNFQRISQ